MLSAERPMHRMLVWDTTGLPALFGAYEQATPDALLLARLERHWNEPKSQSEWLFRAVHEALSLPGWSAQSIDALGVVTGPGSFTGIRVGIALARTWAQVSSVPVFVTSSLSVESAAAGICIRPAATGEWYSHDTAEPFAETLRTQAELSQWLRNCSKTEALSVGLENHAFQPTLDSDVSERMSWREFSDSRLMRFAADAFGGRISPTRWPEPHYLRDADATRKLKQGLLKPQPAVRQGQDHA